MRIFIVLLARLGSKFQLFYWVRNFSININIE